MSSTDGSVDEITQSVRALMTPPGQPVSNLDGGQIHTVINMANRWFQERLAEAGTKEASFRATFTVGANVTFQEFSNLPDGQFLEPSTLHERKNGITTDPWRSMTFVHPLPLNAQRTERLRFWDLGGDNTNPGLLFVGATVAAQIRMVYVGRLKVHISDPREAAVISGSTDILASYAAHLLCLAKQTPQGRASAADHMATAEDLLHSFIARDSKTQQRRPGRPWRPRFGMTALKGF